MSREAAASEDIVPIRVLLVEDHSTFRQALALTFSLEPDIQVIGQARSIAEARPLIHADHPIDVVVLDLDLPDGRGTDLIHELHATHPATQVLVLTASKGRHMQARAVEAGAAGVLHKSVDIEQVVSAVRRLVDTGWLLSPRDLSALLQEARTERDQQQTLEALLRQLTPREKDVLGLLGEGMSDKEIGARLGIGKDTVHSHMVNLLGKLGAESRLQALIVAVRQGLITIDREG